MNENTPCPVPKAGYGPDDLARDRTALANERTYAAWVRTGLALLATALGIAKFMDASVPDWAVRSLAGILIMLAAGAFALAAWRYMGLCLKLKSLDIPLVPHHVMMALSGFLVACAALAFFAVWMMTQGL